MMVCIYVGYRKGDWFVDLGGYTVCLYKKDERDAEKLRQGELKVYHKSSVITKAALIEAFGAQLKKQLDKPYDKITFNDCGYFASKGVFSDGVKRKI